MLAVLIAAISSHQRAWKEINRLDDEIKTALSAIDVEVAEHFEINRGREELPKLSSYSFGGNGYGSGSGGIIEGPSTMDREIVVSDDVNVSIEIRSDWFFFAGKPYITFDADDSPGNSWFINLLNKQLKDDNATARIGQ